MNHLAHFLLAQGEPHLEVGAFLGDYVKGSLKGEYPRAIENGIHLHRKIDAFTDAHETIKKSCDCFDPHMRRYAPIMIDVFYDHLLARHWHTYGEGNLIDFSDRVFANLESSQAIMPARAREAAQRMQQHQVLAAYADENFLVAVLSRLSQRLKRANPVAEGFSQFSANQQQLSEDFASFFPQVMAFAQEIVDDFST